MKLFRKMKGKLGFTLAELLVVIALLAIVTAIAVPNTAAYVKRIKLTELDDSARSIYMAAQNRLDALKAQGTDLSKSATLIDDALTRYSSPAGTMYYVSRTPSGSTGGFMNVSAIESELEENNYIIEYDPETGIVYGVFYSESELLKDIYTTQGPNNMITKFSDRLDYKYEDKSVLIGYYGGSAYVATEPSENLPTPDFTVFNREKLYFEITPPALTDSEDSRAYLSITISDGINTPISIIPDGCYLNKGGDKVTIILDTLSDVNDTVVPNSAIIGTIEKSFEKWVEGSGVVPGSDITIEVTYYDPNGVNISKSSKKENINSLFANGSTATTANIEYGRHLQNLNNTTYSITTVNINKDIDFSSTKGNYEGWATTYPVGEDSYRQFVAVTNTASITDVNGNNHTIKRAVVSGAGLFDTLSANVTNLKLVNTKVTNTSGNAGALAGTMSNGSITNVEVYVDKGVYTWDDPTNDPHSNYTISGSGNVGGLVGEANGTTIMSSYASVKVVGGTAAGGLVGSTNGMTLKNAYSGGHTYKGSYDLEDGTPLINVKGATAGGIIGNVTGTVKVEDIVYSTCSVEGTTNSDTAFGSVSGSLNISEGATCYAAGYNYGTGDKTKSALHDNGVKTGDEAKSTTSSVTKANYDKSLTAAFPYVGLTVHRGDWVSDPVAGAIGFFYWEYENGSYNFIGYYFNTDDTSKTAKSLGSALCTDEDATAITKYGYGYFYTTAPDSDPSLFGNPDIEATDKIKAALSDFNNAEVVAYVVDSVLGHGVSYQTFTATVNSEAYSVYYNPDFYAISASYSDFGSSAHPYEVRTVNQLQHVGKYLNEYFLQSHDIDGKSASADHKPIGENETKPFKGSYNGQSYRIIELNIDSSGKYVGIFGVTEDAVLENIILFAPASENANSGSYVLGGTANAHYIGGIVGYAKVAETKTASLPNGALIGLSTGTEAGLKVSSLGISSGEARVVNAYNNLYAKTAALGAVSGAKVVAMAVADHTHHFPEYADWGHWGTCTVEGCDEPGGWVGHTLENGKCLYCDYEYQCPHYSQGTNKDETYHWTECWDCGEILSEKEKHVPNGVSNPQSGEWYQCSVCWTNFQYSACDEHDYNYDEWKSDSNNHWHECTVCGDKTDIESHTLGNYTNNGDNHTAACTACGNTVTQSHSVQGDYTCTSRQHSYTCACGAEVSESHTESNWITDVKATADTDGHRYKECTVCKYVIDEQVIPAGKQPNDCPYCGSSNTGKMGPWDDDGHDMRCYDCGKDFKAEHTISLTKGQEDGGQPLGQLGEFDYNLGREVTIEDIENVLQTYHLHFCETCDYKEPLPLTMEEVYVVTDGEMYHRYKCIYCNGSVMLQSHDLRWGGSCDICDGTYKKRTPDNSVNGITNCAVAGYTLKDSTSSGNTYVGGIAGYSDVPIKNCEAVVDIVCVNGRTSDTANYGGIAGESAHYITDCYTGGKLDMYSQKHGHNHVGLIVGEIGSTDWVKYCYSYMVDRTNHGSNDDIEFNGADTATTSSLNPRTYVTSPTTENSTKYKYEPKIYDYKDKKPDGTIPADAYEHYGYFN